MKVKSNYVKSLLIALGIAWLFTSVNSNAFFVDKPYQHCNRSDSQFFPNCSSYGDLSYSPNLLSSDYTDFNNLNYYTNGSSFANNRGIYGLNDGNNIVSSKLYSYNDGDYFNFTRGNQGSWNYNFINIYSVGSYYGFSWWSDSEKKYQSIDFSSLPILEDDVFAYFSPRHGMFTFYNRDYLEGIQTVQYIGNKRLRDYVIYVDPLDQDENIWLIDYYNLKAWSMYTGNVITINKFMFGSTDLQLGNRNFIDSLPRQNSYTMSLVNGSNYFYPHTDGNQACSPNDSNGANSNICKSSKYLNIGFSFTSDLEYQPPHFGNGNSGNNSGSGDQMTIDFLKCVDTYTSIGNMAKLINSCNNSCNSQGNDNSCGDYFFYMNNYTGTGSYIGSIDSVSCRDMLNYANSFYLAANSDLEIYHDRLTSAFTYADRGVEIDPSSICSAYASEDQKYEMLNFFEKIQYQFSSGYNYFNVPSCSDNYIGKSYAWGNYLLIFVAGWILFILFSVF